MSGRRPVAAAVFLGGVLAVLVAAGGPHGLSAGASRTAPSAPGWTDVAVSDRTAKALGGAAGDLIDVAPTAAGPWRRVRIAQVYRPLLYPTEVADRDADIRLHLPDLQSLTGLGDAADSIVVRLRRPADAPHLAADASAMGLGLHAYTSADLARRNSTSFEVVARFHRAIGAIAVLAGSVFLVTIMTLRGEEMRREVGTMRLVGIGGRTVAAAVLLIAAAVATAGSVAGVGLAYVLSFVINAYYGRVFDTDLVFSRVTWGLIADAAALSVLLGIAAGGLTAWRLLRRHPLEQLGR
jgi:ABC-type lipoprotein release transport system permease subunit